ncbi:MAG: ATP-binding protein [Clostridia bacterium]|nr:ATP-binding protein [Clostridia bacterium]
MNKINNLVKKGMNGLKSQKHRGENKQSSQERQLNVQEKLQKCSLCQDRGIIIENDGAKPCPCMKQKSFLNRFKNAHFTREMLKSSFEKFNFDYYDRNSMDRVKNISYYDSAMIAYNAARNFVTDFLKDAHTDGLLLTGQVGSGKTYLACCIANALMDKGVSVLMVVVPDLLDEIKATYDQGRSGSDYSEQQLLDSARQVDVLILDDLGAHNYTDWTRNKIFSIINYRLNNQLPTIITSNLSLKELKEYLGERTTSRIIQMCRVYRLIVDRDIRIVKRHEKEILNLIQR